MYRFWSVNWGGKILALLVTGFAIAMFNFDGCGIHHRNRFEHDLRLAIAGHPDTVSVNIQAQKAGRIIRRLVEYQSSEMTPYLRDSLGYHPTVRLKAGTTDRETLYTTDNADVIASMMAAIGDGRSLPLDSLVSLKDTLVWRQPVTLKPLCFSQRPMMSIIADLKQISNLGDDDRRFQQVVRDHPFEAAGNYFGRINMETLPSDSPTPKASGKLMFIWWAACSAMMFIFYFFQLDYPSEVFEDVNWFRPSTYVSLLCIAPASVVVLTLYGLLIGIDRLKDVLDTDVRELRRRPPEPPPQAQPRPEPPRFVHEPPPFVRNAHNDSEPEEPELLRTGTPCYFLAGLRDQLIRLTGSGITAEDYWLSGRWGIILAQSDLDRANRTMGLLIETNATQATDNPNLVEVIFDREAAQQAARRASFDIQREEIRGSYVELLSRRLRYELETTKDELRRLVHRQHDLFREATSMEMQRELLAAREAQIREVMAKHTSPEWLGQEFDHLCALPEVKYIEVESNAVHIYTNMLYAEEETWPETTYFELGEFELILNLDGTVLMKNLTHRRGSKDHPGLIDGAGCLGNVAMGMALHIGRAQFTIAAQMCFAFLTRDIRGGYRSGGWKEVPREQALAATASHETVTDPGTAAVSAIPA